MQPLYLSAGAAAFLKLQLILLN